MAGMSFLYCVVFISLVCLQFSKKENAAPRVKAKPASSKPAGSKPASNQFDPAAFTLAQARNAHTFNEALEQWRNQAFSYWNQGISARSDEETVIAYCGESLRRGNYRSALAAIPFSYLEGGQRS
jgi:glucan phosphoethanolaminetransferase (alkaline phosphatase superfamily)